MRVRFVFHSLDSSVLVFTSSTRKRVGLFAGDSTAHSLARRACIFNVECPALGKSLADKLVSISVH